MDHERELDDCVIAMRQATRHDEILHDLTQHPESGQTVARMLEQFLAVYRIVAPRQKPQ